VSAHDAFVRGHSAATPIRSRWLGPGLAVAVLVAVSVVSYQPASDDVAFDPRWTGDTGLAATVDLLEVLDVDVAVVDSMVDASTADTVLVAPLGWSEEEIFELASLGPRVIAVARPDDESVPASVAFGGIGLVTLDVVCTLLPDVAVLRSGSWGGWQQVEGAVAADTDRCLAADGAAWLTRVDVGAGELIALGTMEPFLNARFFDSDASIALVRLLAPTGDEVVRLVAAPQRTAELTLFDIVDPRWFDAAWLSLAALLVLVLSRGRRLGTPVSEQLPVRVPSGELARAVGDLRHRAGQHRASGAALRERTTRHLARRLGLPASASPQDVLRALEATGQPATSYEVAALAQAPPDDGDGLVSHARTLAALRSRVAGVGATPLPRTAASAIDLHNLPDQDTP
jgi:hypothetical protein